MVTVFVPAGESLMGSSDSVANADSEEKLQLFTSTPTG
jgi:hypothetical protein